MPTPDGKLDARARRRARLARIGDEHAVQPRVVSITQSTELGTLYTVDEMRALADHAHAHGLLLHVDGARLANAAAALGVALRRRSRPTSAPTSCRFGGTKAGLLAGEAVVFLRPGAAATRCPTSASSTLQLASKMRFVAAQFEALLERRALAARGRARQRDGAAPGRGRGRRRGVR